jgi:hypothetical protein
VDWSWVLSRTCAQDCRVEQVNLLLSNPAVRQEAGAAWWETDTGMFTDKGRAEDVR